MSRPYFYIIQHIKTKMFYAGYKSSKADSSMLLAPDGYHTSSRYVQDIIQEEGVDSFIIRKIRHFDCKLKARLHEVRFLRRVNAMKNARFLNRSNGDGAFQVEHSAETKMKISKAGKGRVLSDEHKRKLSLSQKGKPKSDESKRRMSASAKAKAYPTEEHRRKISEANKGNKSAAGKRKKPLSSETKSRMKEAQVMRRLYERSLPCIQEGSLHVC